MERAEHAGMEGVTDAADLAERRAPVRAALQTLPTEQRQVLEMAYFAGMTQVQIAEEIGIPLGTVKTRTLAAMRKLRRALDRSDDATRTITTTPEDR